MKLANGGRVVNSDVLCRVVASGIVLLCGCKIAGGVSRKDSEKWLSRFVDAATAHAICYHEDIAPGALAATYRKWYVNDDIRYLLLSHPRFPMPERLKAIEDGSAPEIYIGNNVESVSDEEVLSYLRCASNSWFSRCRPLYCILMTEGKSPELYVEAWSLYKKKRERMPLWGWVLPCCQYFKLEGIRSVQNELENILKNEGLPDTVRDEVFEHLQIR